MTDVSWNYRVKKRIKPFKPRPPDAPDGTWRMDQADVDRVQEFRKCIECFLCQDVCHVLRDHHMHDEFIGPRFLVHVAALEMHPLDTADRLAELKEAHGIGYCNITKCCTKVCPEHITITDNAIIPLKERVVDEFYDPLTARCCGCWVRRRIRDKRSHARSRRPSRRFEGEAMFDSSPSRPRRSRWRWKRRSATAAQRAGAGGEHLPGHARHRPREPAALVMLLLALTDQFRAGPAECFQQAEAVVPRLHGEYERLYYGGIICERRG